MIILISNNTKIGVHVNQRITSRVFSVGFEKLRTACSWHFASLCPLWDSFLPPFMAKMYTKNLEIFENNLRARFVKLSIMAG